MSLMTRSRRWFSPTFSLCADRGKTESIVSLGPVQSVSFKRVGPAGGDIYDVTFERGAREFRILLDPDGRIHAAQFSP